MAEVVLIHGYAVGMTSLLRRPLPDHRGFAAFANDLAINRARVFSWGLTEPLSLKQFFNPFFIYAFYRRERALAEDPQTLDRLKVFLESEQPRVIICHSMGAFLLARYLKRHFLPSSVKRVLLVQADIDTNEDVATPVSLTNVFCPWDSTLAFSSLLHVRPRAGLVGLRQANNVLFPLFRPINLHTSSIRDPHLRRMIFTK